MIEAGLYRWAAPFLDLYNRRLLRSSFARIRVAGLEELRVSRPVIAAPNHTCWWDGCVDLHLTREVVEIESFLMMGEAELSRHRIFSSLGVFGVADERNKRERSASVRYTLELLGADTPRVVWIYPQGEMRPAREPVAVEPGVAYLASRTGAPVIPVAHRYEFVADDHPEVLVRIGNAIDGIESGSGWLEEALESLLGTIDQNLLERDFGGYETVIEGPTPRHQRVSSRSGRF